MKKGLLFFVILLSVVFSTQAQKKQGSRAGAKTPEQISTNVSSKMATKYALNEDQKTKLYQSTLSRVTKVRDVKAKYPNASTVQADKKAMHQELKPIRESYKTDLQGILTAEQFAQFQKDSAAKKDQKKGNGKSQKSMSPTDEVDAELGE